MGNFREIKAWRRGIDIAKAIYNISKDGTLSRDFGLRDQMRRAAVSIASNIAEGDELNTNKQGINHFYYARASSAELVTQLTIAYEIGYIDEAEYQVLIDMCLQVSRMINGLIRYRKN